MAKKANKQSVDKVVKKVNKEFDKTSSQIEKLINDANWRALEQYFDPAALV